MMVNKRVSILSLLLAVFAMWGCNPEVIEEAPNGFYRDCEAVKEIENIKTFEIISKTDTLSFQVQSGHNLEPFKVTLANLDAESPVSLYLTKEGWPDLRSNQSIIGSIISDGMSEKEKAIALWKFISNWAYHARPISETSHDLHDPVKLLNVFGYGSCGDLNGALACLGELSGLETRFWVLEGHTVTEVFFEDSWHMFDAMFDVYYADDNGKIVGVDYLVQHPETILNSGKELFNEKLFRRYFNLDKESKTNIHDKFISENFKALQDAFREEFEISDGQELDFELMHKTILSNYAGFFSSSDDNWVEEGRSSHFTNHSLEIVLYPEEELTYYFLPLSKEANKIMCYASRQKCYDGHGRVVRKLSENRIRRDKANEEIIFKEQFPYTINALHIGLRENMNSSSADVYFSNDKLDWVFLGNLEKINPSKTEIYYDLFIQYPDEFLNEYYIKFASDDLDKIIEGVVIENEFLFSFLSVPHPSADSSSYVLQSDWGKAESTSSQGVKVGLAWTGGP